MCRSAEKVFRRFLVAFCLSLVVGFSARYIYTSEVHPPCVAWGRTLLTSDQSETVVLEI